MLENSARVLRNRAWISAWKKGNGAKEERENERNTRQFPMENRRKAMKEREREKEGKSESGEKRARKREGEDRTRGRVSFKETAGSLIYK